MLKRRRILENRSISRNIVENEKELKKRLGIGTSFDVGVRKLSILNTEVQIYFVNGLCDDLFIIELIRELLELNDEYDRLDDEKKTFDIIHNHIAHMQVERTTSLDDAITQMLSGLIFILVDGYGEAFIVDVRSYPGRQPEEPDTERVVRGARDGFTENIVLNTALTRRRIRDERLRNEILQVGVRSKTDVCISYIDGIADPDLISILKEELKSIEIDGIPMADKVIEEYVLKQGFNPFPLVRFTERPDVAAMHLLEGHVILMIDTSPSVIVIAVCRYAFTLDPFFRNFILSIYLTIMVTTRDRAEFSAEPTRLYRSDGKQKHSDSIANFNCRIRNRIVENGSGSHSFTVGDGVRLSRSALNRRNRDSSRLFYFRSRFVRRIRDDRHFRNTESRTRASVTDYESVFNPSGHFL